MANPASIYRTLQRHLNQQPVGFPATYSGAAFRLLQRLFTPVEAELALHLDYKPRTLTDIWQTISANELAFADMEHLLDGMLEKGLIGHKERQEHRYYYLIPLVVGMYEGQLPRLTPALLEDFDAYTSQKAFGLAFLSTDVPQMRTIPVEQSIPIEHQVTTYDHLTQLITTNDGPIVINECICRKKAAMQGHPCTQTSRLETCMAMGDIARNCVRIGLGREISQEEALDIARQNAAEHLILQPSNTQVVEFICACCGCCCGMLQVHKQVPKPVEFWATNYYATVNEQSCTGCANCQKACQMEAIHIDGNQGIAVIDRDRCLGCGNCVISCVSEAVQLVHNSREVAPPPDIEALYETLMAHKKGLLGKLKLAARLILYQ